MRTKADWKQLYSEGYICITIYHSKRTEECNILNKYNSVSMGETNNGIFRINTLDQDGPFPQRAQLSVLGEQRFTQIMPSIRIL